MRISLEHLSIEALAANLRRHVRYGFRNTATVLALIAEMDERKLYLELGYPSMYAYCVGELHFSEDGARKRIHAARAARRIPALLSAIEDGRLHLSAVVLLAPCLTSENATELLAAATHKTKREVEQLVAEWFPRLDEPVLLSPVNEPIHERTPGRVERHDASPAQFEAAHVDQFAEEDQRAPGRVDSQSERAVVKPLGPQRFALQLTMDQATHDKIRYLQELLSHQVPYGDLAAALGRTFEIAIRHLERRKFAATSRPAKTNRSQRSGSRHNRPSSSAPYGNAMVRAARS